VSHDGAAIRIAGIAVGFQPFEPKHLSRRCDIGYFLNLASSRPLDQSVSAREDHTLGLTTTRHNRLFCIVVCERFSPRSRASSFPRRAPATPFGKVVISWRRLPLTKSRLAPGTDESEKRGSRVHANYQSEDTPNNAT